MEQFRQIGEALGSLKALMVFREDLQINQRQCSLLLDLLSSAYEVVAEEIRHNLRFDERQVKWRILEQPLKDLLRVYKESELYIRSCLDIKDLWARVIALYQNTDCIDLHIHNFFCCIPVVIEAIEIAGELAGCDHFEMQKKRLVYTRKYQEEWKDPKLFQWKYGKQYLTTPEICMSLQSVWKEDRWILINRVRDKSLSVPTTKKEQRLNDLLARNMDMSEPSQSHWKFLPSTLLLGSKDYQVKRRLGVGGGHKEITWLGETFAVKQVTGNAETVVSEISALHALSHPNIIYLLCSFTDEEKKEYFLITELMNRDLGSYVTGMFAPKKRIAFSLPVVVDLMLQIARGMEYLHHKKIYHGDLNPSKILVKARGNSTEGYLHAKVSGFGLSHVKSSHLKSPSALSPPPLPFIWHAPEVLAEGEGSGSPGSCKFTEKSDVYSYGMICFELLTGKVPFEDAHLQGDKMSRNIRAGERPLFPFHCPKYLTNLTKRCWHTDPVQRPSFSSICRILRYVKRFQAINPEHSVQTDPPPMPLVDYLDIELTLLRKFPSWEGPGMHPVTEIPFQMYVYRAAEREKMTASLRGDSESGSDTTSGCGDENIVQENDPFKSTTERKLSVSPEPPVKNLTALLKRLPDEKSSRTSVMPRRRMLRPPQISARSRSMRMNSEGQLLSPSPRIRIRRSPSLGHVSDSELH